MNEIPADVRILLTLVESDAKRKIDENTDLEGRVKTCMRSARDGNINWMGTNEDGAFRAALGAAMLLSDDGERHKIERSVRAMTKAAAMLTSMQAGVPVDLEQMLADQEADLAEGGKYLPLQEWWQETDA